LSSSSFSLTHTASVLIPLLFAFVAAQVDVSNNAKTTKVTISSKDGAVAKGWASRPSLPKDKDEWSRWLRSAIPWVAGAAIVLAAATSMKRNKDGKGYGKAAGRKARRAGEKAESALDDFEDGAERNWFGLKRNVEEAADETGNKLESAKNAAARKVRNMICLFVLSSLLSVLSRYSF